VNQRPQVMPATIATLTVMRAEHDRLRRMLPALQWADECHLVETGPDPAGTRRIAANLAVVHEWPLPEGGSFDAARQAAVTHITSDWVLVVDTDECVPDALVRRLRAMASAWQGEGIEGVWLPRLNHVLGRPLLHSSAWPDYQLRFLQRQSVRFSDRLHHTTEGMTGPTVKLPAEPAMALHHFSFVSTKQWLEKMNLYSDIEADQTDTSVEPGSVRRAIAKAAQDFAVRYLKMKGYRDGPEGLHYCIMSALNCYLIEFKVWERTHRDSR
jgi:hypothetical protein